MIFLCIFFGAMGCILIGFLRAGGGRPLASFLLYMFCMFVTFPLIAICPKLHMRIMDWTININKDSPRSVGVLEGLADDIGRSVAKHMKEEKK